MPVYFRVKIDTPSRLYLIFTAGDIASSLQVELRLFIISRGGILNISHLFQNKNFCNTLTEILSYTIKAGWVTPVLLSPN